jgi:chemotaxis protein MotB
VLSAAGQATLDKMAGALAQLAAAEPDQMILVGGHTDDVPIKNDRFASNWELSTARATTVLRELIERHGLPAGRLQAAGYADQRPVAGNDTVEDRAANRRVEIVVLSTVTNPAATPDTTTTPAPATDKKDTEQKGAEEHG